MRGHFSSIGPVRHRRRRALYAAVAAVGAAAALVFVGAAPASAVHNTGYFELDGNAVNGPAAGDDWDNVCHEAAPSTCPDGSNTSGATATSFTNDGSLNASIFTGGGSKDPQDISSWAWKDGAGGLPDKDNLVDSFAARYSEPTGADCPTGNLATCELLFFGSDRYDNSGDAQQGFWFFQNAIGLANNAVSGGSGFSGVHKTGDLLVISDFSNGGTTSTITVYKWDPTCKKAGGTCGDANLRRLATSTAANCLSSTLATNDNFCGAVNPTDGTTAPWAFTDKSGFHSYLNGEFYEGGINLSELGLGNECFSSVASETRSSTSTTATLKDFVLGQFGSCGSSLATQSSVTGSTSIGAGSVSASDAATLKVTGTSAWSGRLQFSLRGPIGSALETSQNVGNAISVSNNTSQPVSSDTATVTAAGDYCWSAEFTSATNGVPDAVDNGDNECFTVAPVTPRLATAASANVLLGNPVSDTATLSGTANEPGTPAINPATAGGPAAGSISFTLYGPNDCTTVAYSSPAVPVSGDGNYDSPNYTPTAVGTYHWAASYSGDSPNTNATSHNTDCSDAGEDVVVSSVASSIDTAQSFIPNDAATVSAPQGGALAGNVKFEAFESSDCSGNAIYTQTLAVSGASPQTVKTTNTTVSTTASNLSWQVTYTSTNTGQRGIPASCFEKSTLTINNGGTVSSP